MDAKVVPGWVNILHVGRVHPLSEPKVWVTKGPYVNIHSGINQVDILFRSEQYHRINGSHGWFVVLVDNFDLFDASQVLKCLRCLVDNFDASQYTLNDIPILHQPMSLDNFIH